MLGISTYKKSINKELKYNSHSIKSLAKKYYDLAENLRNNFKYKEAIEKYLNSILIDRNNYDSYLGIAFTYKNLYKSNK